MRIPAVGAVHTSFVIRFLAELREGIVVESRFTIFNPVYLFVYTPYECIANILTSCSYLLLKFGIETDATP